MFQISVGTIFLCFVVCALFNNVKCISKRGDIELQSCIENFEVHKDKIIRTQDSRNMGATYLNEIDLGSREECLRLCCETDTCDVFVYEEKSPGSCYLFHCGPPEDFKCKFTRHANYSSAVLSVNRHLNELENQIKLTKHEQDLSRLRKPDEVRPAEVEVKQEATRSTPLITTSSSTPRTKIVKEIIPQVEATKTTIGRRCSRNQFECRTSGECIAIYNACDGIPQCADGSDESPELGCPELTTMVAPSPPPPPLPLPVVHNNVYGQTPQIRKLLPAPYQQSQQNTVENPDFLRPAPIGGPYNEAQVVPVQQQQGPFVAPSSNWMPHQGGPIAVPQNVQYASDKNSHIFNHKENGLQVVDTPDSGGAPQYADMNMRNEYPKLGNYYGDVYRPPQYQVPENWQPHRQITADTNPYDNWQPVQIPQPVAAVNNDQNNRVYQQSNIAEAKPNWKTDLINTQAVSSKTYDHTVIHEPEKQLAKDHHVVEPKHLAPNSNEHSHHAKEHGHAHIAEELKQNVEELLDGEAERPGGAVLSLTLGVCLSCVMAILIGCRLRVVRRRMRRGGKSPYAHDADYLVNGMYL